MRCFLTFLLIVTATPCLSGEQKGGQAEINIRQIDGPIDHNHCTTRQFQHMTFCHEGTWFVFYSDGKDLVYQTSIDKGKTWERAEHAVTTAPNGSSSHDVLKVGNMVFLAHAFYPLGRYDVNAPYAKDPSRRGEYTHEGRIKQGRIEGRHIRWAQDVDPGSDKSQILVALVPSKDSDFDLGDVRLGLSEDTPHSGWSADAIQFSATNPPVKTVATVASEGTELRVSIGKSVAEPVLLLLRQPKTEGTSQ